MFLGIPLDLRIIENIRVVVNTFRKFRHWVSDDPYLVWSIVFALFPEDILVPRDVVFAEYALFGGAKVSWTTPCYILGANFAEQMPEDEDPMPLDGNPHPLPGHVLPEEHNFVLRPYPAIGWNNLPPIPPPAHDHVENDNWGNAIWGEEDNVQLAEDIPLVQDQESMVIDQLVFSESEVQMDVPEFV